MKNLTHLAAVLGTWTADTHLHCPYHGGFDRFDVHAYLVVHFMVDPMRSSGCQRSDCLEFHNRLCLHRPLSELVDSEVCVRTDETVVEWSDLLAFFSFGFDVTSTPANVRIQKSSGGWLGPYHLILAQDLKNTGSTSNTNHTTDKYKMRYVTTPSTAFLRPNPNATLYGFDDFMSYAGSASVQNSIERQLDLLPSSTDPYNKYANTCRHGNVESMLPKFEITFDSTNSMETTTMTVNLTYKILTSPRDGTDEATALPLIQQALDANRKTANHTIHQDLSLSGPYCYHNNVNGSWTFDLNVSASTPILRNSSNDPTSSSSQPQVDDSFVLVRGCVSGLDCLPQVTQLWNPSLQHVIVYHRSKYSTNDLSKFLLTAMCYVLGLSFLISIACNANLRRSHNQYVRRLRVLHEDEVIAASTIVSGSSTSVVATRSTRRPSSLPEPNGSTITTIGINRGVDRRPYRSQRNLLDSGTFPTTTDTSLHEPLLLIQSADDATDLEHTEPEVHDPVPEDSSTPAATSADVAVKQETTGTEANQGEPTEEQSSGRSDPLNGTAEQEFA